MNRVNYLVRELTVEEDGISRTERLMTVCGVRQGDELQVAAIRPFTHETPSTSYLSRLHLIQNNSDSMVFRILEIN